MSKRFCFPYLNKYDIYNFINSFAIVISVFALKTDCSVRAVHVFAEQEL